MEFGITKWDFEEALIRTKYGKAPGLDGINSELGKYASAGFKNGFLNFYNRVILSAGKHSKNEMKQL